MYCQLLQQSIAHMQGRYTAPRPDAALRTDFIVNSEPQFAAKSRQDYLGAFLPRDYIRDAAPVSYTHLDVYKRQATFFHIPNPSLMKESCC